MTNPDIVFLGLRIAEPVTSATDLVTATVAFLAATGLRRAVAPGDNSRVHSRMEWYFFLLGFATLYSGIIGHAFAYAVPARLRLVGWAISGVAILMAELATNEALLEERLYSSLGLFAIIPWLQFALFLVYLLSTTDFTIVKQNSVIGLIVYVIPLQYLLEGTAPSEGRRVYMSGIMMGILPAIVYTRQIAISRWFNHHDISHLLMSFVIFTMYRGVRRSILERIPALRSREEATPVASGEIRE